MKSSSWRPNKRRIKKCEENKKNTTEEETKLSKNLFATLYKEMFLCTQSSFFLTVIIHTLLRHPILSSHEVSYSFNWLDVVRVVVVAVAVSISVAVSPGQLAVS